MRKIRNIKTMPSVNSEEDKHWGKLVGWAGGQDGASWLGGPVSRPNIDPAPLRVRGTEGGEKSCHQNWFLR